MSGYIRNAGNPAGIVLAILLLGLALLAAGCARRADNDDTAIPASEESEAGSGEESGEEVYTLDTKVMDVINDPVFGDYGRLIFPADRTISQDLTLEDVGDILVWYNS